MFRIPGSVALISLDTASGDVQRLVDWVPHLDETDAAVLADPHRTESEWLPACLPDTTLPPPLPCTLVGGTGLMLR